MKIANIKLTNFRNWEEISLDFSDRVLIYGPNARGKTNILEALYILATTRSFRGRESELVRLGEGFARVTGQVTKNDKTVDVEALMSLNGKLTKEFKINEKARSVIDFVGEFAAIVFSPDDLLLISGPPELKRRYLSFTIGQKDREYLFCLLNYKKILKHRNELLKKADLGRIKEEIDIWDHNLAENGQKVINKRYQLADFINERINQYYTELSSQQRSLKFVYKPALWGEDLAESLSNARDRDIMEKNTTVGPHRDNWEIEIDGELAAKFASRGEYRTIILSLKLCERDWFLAHGTEMPVILLDDVFSELDESRRKYLVEAFSDAQLVITTTDLDHLDASLRENTQLVNIEEVGE